MRASSGVQFDGTSWNGATSKACLPRAAVGRAAGVVTDSVATQHPAASLGGNQVENLLELNRARQGRE